LRCAKNADACWRRDDIACNYCIDQKNKCVSINDLILIRLFHLMLVKSHVNFVKQSINWWTCDVEFMSKSCRKRFWTEKLRVSSSLLRSENVIWSISSLSLIRLHFLSFLRMSCEIFSNLFELSLVLFFLFL
jgi:hypothetical protein